MTFVVRARIIDIGTSRGIQIPLPLLEQAGLVDLVEIRVEGDQLIIQAARETAYPEKHAPHTENSARQEALSPTIWGDDDWTW